MSSTLNITLNAENLTKTVHDEDGEPIETTLEDMVVEEAARMLMGSIQRDVRSEVQAKIRSVADEMIREAMQPTLEAALEGEAWRRTDTWGSPVGEAKTLRQHIADEAIKYVAKAPGSRNGTDGIHAYVNKQIEAVVKAELAATLDEAKEAVRAKLAAEGAKLLTDAIQQAAGVKAAKR